jgi:predicted TIM-barrel fold metal-dependent hydrolase
MRIDSHQHFWRCHAVRDWWITKMRVLQRGSDWRGTDAFICQPSGRTGAARYSRRSALRAVCLLAGLYDRVRELVADFVRGRPGAEQAKIFGETAARFYGLKVRHGLTTQG